MIPQANKAERLRQEIMVTVRANGEPATGELWLSLAFRTESELVKIAQALHINTKHT